MIKLDLSKAYDRMNRIYIRILLTHLGFEIDFISWVMSCTSMASFAVLLNGEASSFFHVERGLRQGCPLSPFVFLLVVEGISRFLENAKREGDLKDYKYHRYCISLISYSWMISSFSAVGLDGMWINYAVGKILRINSYLKVYEPWRILPILKMITI